MGSELAVRWIHVFRVRQMFVEMVDVKRIQVLGRFFRQLADGGNVEDLNDLVERDDFVLVGQLVDRDEFVSVRDVSMKFRRQGEDNCAVGR